MEDYKNILDEYDYGAFFTDELLCYAFLTFLKCFERCGAVPEESERVLAFLDAGYHVYSVVRVAAGEGDALVDTVFDVLRRKILQQSEKCELSLVLYEFDNGSFYSDKLLCEAYLNFLKKASSGASLPLDARGSIVFLRHGLDAYVRLFATVGKDNPRVYAISDYILKVLRGHVRDESPIVTPSSGPGSGEGRPQDDGCMLPAPEAAVSQQEAPLPPPLLPPPHPASDSFDDVTEGIPPLAIAPGESSAPPSSHCSEEGGPQYGGCVLPTPEVGVSRQEAPPPLLPPPACEDQGVTLPAGQVGGSVPAALVGRKRQREEEEDEEYENEEPEGLQAPTIRVLDTTERLIRRFKLKCREEVCVIEGLQHGHLDIERTVTNMFEEILERQKQAVSANDDDFCFFEIRSDNNPEKPIFFSQRRCDELTGGVVLDKLCRILNSNESFLTSGRLHISFIHMPLPRPGGRSVIIRNETMDRWVARYVKTGRLFDPRNQDDEMCLTRCVAVSMLHNTVDKHKFSRIKKASSFQQKEEALRLCQLADIDPMKKCSMAEVHRLQRALPDYRLVIYDENKFYSTVFEGPMSTVEKERKNLYLLWFGGHFYSILSVTAVFGYSYHCERCLKCFTNKNVHKCCVSCYRCSSPVVHIDDPSVQLIKCRDCHRYFAGIECFDSHKIEVGGVSNCERLKYCSSCEKTYVVNPNAKNPRKHNCNLSICKYCKQNTLQNHLCFMQEWEPKPLSPKVRHMRIYFDTETTQMDLYGGQPGVFEHKPNLLISQQVCTDCEDSEVDACDKCGIREQVFQSFDDEDTNVIDLFIDYLLKLSSECRTEIVVMAHNFKQFDGVFIVERCLKRKLRPKLILQGAKIISLQLNNIHFKDSIMFVPQKLSSLPKSFGLNELKKGYFCHLANRPEYFNYEGPLPEKNMYCTSSMSEKELKDFNDWYDTQKSQGYVFNFRKEITEYCRSDVDILKKAMEVFRKDFMEIADFDPLKQSITLSSACMSMYRKKHMPSNTLGIVPQGGYRGRDMASHEALKWLAYEQHVLGPNVKIQTAENGREFKVMNKKVDGYCEIMCDDGTVEKRIYQYHGCYFHHCPECIRDEKFRKKLRGRNDDPYLKTQNISTNFRSNGYKVVEMWACQFKRLLKNSPEMNDYFEQNPFTRTEPLKIRDAIMGGRTSALKTYAKADLSKGEEIRFYDVCSEYPYCNFKMAYPYGHPSIYLDTDPSMPDVKTWNGIAKISVLPPDDLELPVLPYKCSSKLMFPLCRKCTETLQSGPCNHSPDERMITGTWCAPEIHLALSKKYKIVKTHEVYQYPGVKQYNPEKGEEGLFSAYVKTNMALKVEASGWPSHVKTEEDKEAFIKDMFEKDGIVIRKDKVIKNPGKRTLAKLILNSFWGKLGEKTLRPSTEFVHTYAQLVELTTNPLIEVVSVLPYGDDCLQVRYMPVGDLEDSSPTTSLVHAAFTTCHGRMVLYKYLDMVGPRALYHDTDSICYIARPGWQDPPLGPYLGQLTDQLCDDYAPGSFATEFVAAGPKNYSYQIAVGGDLSNIKTVVKVRGISINSSCSETVTFQNLKKMVFNELDQVQVQIPSKIDRLPGWKIVTRSTAKKWRVCMTKRRRVDMINTVPHGYRGAVLDQDDFDLVDYVIDMDWN